MLAYIKLRNSRFQAHASFSTARIPGGLTGAAVAD